MDDNNNNIHTPTVPPTTLPVPDPTILTTIQLDRSVSNLKSRVDQMFNDRDSKYTEQWTSVYRHIDLQVSHVSKISNAGIERLEERIDRKYDALENIRNISFTAAQDAVNTALQATKEAIGKSETATEKRFDSVNEFRKTLADQTASFIPRAEIEASFKNFQDKLEALSSVYNNRLNDLKESRDIHIGTGDGKNQLWGYIIGAAGLVSSLVAMIAMLAKLR